MTPKITRFVSAAIVALSLAGCNFDVDVGGSQQISVSKGGGEKIIGSGVIRTETRAVGSFTVVRLESAGRVVIQSGETDGVTVSSDDNLLPKITTETRNGVLILDTAADTKIVANELVYRVTINDLRRIDVNGTGTIEASNLTSNALAITVAGASRLRLSGKVGSLQLVISGTGNVDADQLVVGRANIVVSGTGNTSVAVRDTLNAVLSGTGNVTYSGTPQITKTISGTGSLRARLAS